MLILSSSSFWNHTPPSGLPTKLLVEIKFTSYWIVTLNGPSYDQAVRGNNNDIYYHLIFTSDAADSSFCRPTSYLFLAWVTSLKFGTRLRNMKQRNDMKKQKWSVWRDIKCSILLLKSRRLLSLLHTCCKNADIGYCSARSSYDPYNS